MLSRESADVIRGEEVDMIRCLDIHTHHPAPQPLGVVSSGLSDFNPIEGQLYSVGIHPWLSDKMPSEDDWKKLEQIAKMPCVKAIGECGIDKLRGGPMFRQLLILKKQIELSEKMGKPLILHDVKAHDIILGLKKDLNPRQYWVVHGLRGKPGVAKMLTDAGIFVSFGEYFNMESLKITPPNLILAETDESSLSIETIIARISDKLERDVTELIASNTSKFLNLENNEI